MVPVGELRRRKLVRENGEVIPFYPTGYQAYRPHPNFGKRRPDLMIYGAV